MIKITEIASIIDNEFMHVINSDPGFIPENQREFIEEAIIDEYNHTIYNCIIESVCNRVGITVDTYIEWIVDQWYAFTNID